jgi:hypothetical protein
VSPDGELALFAHDVSGSNDRALCEVPTDPAAYEIGGADYAAGPAECGGAPLATLLLQVRGGSLTGAAWSPDGATLALAVQRSDHGFVGVWRRGDGRVGWLAPSFDTDTMPAWSLDGGRLAFLRFRATEDAGGVGGAYQEGPPFSLFVADVGASAARSTDPKK